MRVAINGFGRIGRSVYRILHENDDINVVAINDLFDHHALAYMLQYDTIMRVFPEKVAIDNGDLVTSKDRVKMVSERDPKSLPWGNLDIDVVVEATGVFRNREQLELHLDAGAGRVILTVPAKDEIDNTVVIGVNEDTLKPEHKIVSNASCTTNCLAPMAKILHDAFGIVEGIINTVHAYTNDQRLADVPHKDWRRSRAAAENIIPTTTGAARAVGKVLPELAGRMDGIACRVPVPDGSVVDLVCELEKEVTPDDIHNAVRDASNTPRLKDILSYSNMPIVSRDIIGDPHSSIYDAPFTKVINGRFVKTLNWYDNEWGYANRVVDLIEIFSSWKN
ncbi:type I glyceraldehyde-3-phosphate dehydrogenase [Candidatus Neomarinimicrobiota bacterium]